MGLLQLSELNATVIQRLRESGELSIQSGKPDALEARVEHAIQRLRSTRETEDRHPWSSYMARLDNMIRTDALEHLDEEDFPEERKVRIVRALHRLNTVLGSYWRFCRVLHPLVEEVSERLGRPANILELASGSGEFTLALARQIREGHLRATVTGSDYIQSHVHEGNRLAIERGLPAKFELVNAFDMSHIPKGRFDIVFIAQSIHHFRPGKLALMIAEATRFATTAFVGVDGARGLPVLAFLPFVSALRGRADYVHDGTISARRLYSEPELSLIAELAAPSAHVTVERSRPAMSLLTVRVPSGG